MPDCESFTLNGPHNNNHRSLRTLQELTSHLRVPFIPSGKVREPCGGISSAVQLSPESLGPRVREGVRAARAWEGSCWRLLPRECPRPALPVPLPRLVLLSKWAGPWYT